MLGRDNDNLLTIGLVFCGKRSAHVWADRLGNREVEGRWRYNDGREPQMGMDHRRRATDMQYIVMVVMAYAP